MCLLIFFKLWLLKSFNCLSIFESMQWMTFKHFYDRNKLKRSFLSQSFFNLKSFMSILIEDLSILMLFMSIRHTCLCLLMSIMWFAIPDCTSFNVIYVHWCSLTNNLCFNVIKPHLRYKVFSIKSRFWASRM